MHEVKLLLALPEAVHALVLHLEDGTDEAGALARLGAKAGDLQAGKVCDAAFDENGGRVGEDPPVAVERARRKLARFGNVVREERSESSEPRPTMVTSGFPIAART